MAGLSACRGVSRDTPPRSAPQGDRHRWRRCGHERRPRARRAGRLRRRRLRAAIDPRREGAQHARQAGHGGRGSLPGEHGFRFFPGFYRHVTHTMSRIPYAGQAAGVLDNLVTATEVQLAREDGQERAGHAGSLPGDHQRLAGHAGLRDRVRDQPRDTARRAGALREPPQQPALRVRGAALRAVREPELVGVLGRRAALGGLPEVPRRRAHALARGRASARR